MRKLAIAAFAVAFSLVWSSAFIAGKIALVRFDAATTLALRFALSAALLAPFARAGFNRSDARLGLTLGALNNAAYLGLTFAALALTRAVVVIAIVSCAPFLTALLAALLRIETVRMKQFAGAAIGLGGVAVVTGFDPSGANVAGVALAGAGTLAFSLATLLIRARAGGRSATGLNFWQSLAGAVLLAPIAFVYGRGLTGQSLAPGDPSVLAILYLAVVATILGMAMWLALVKLAGAAGASACHLMNPFFGALLSAVVLGTPLRGLDFVGAAAIAAGLALALDLGATSPRGERS